MNISFVVIQLMAITASIAVLVKLKQMVDNPEIHIKKSNETGKINIVHTIADIVILGMIGATLGYGVFVVADAYTGDAGKINTSLLSAVSGFVGLIAPKVWELAIETSEYIAEAVRDKIKRKVDDYSD